MGAAAANGDVTGPPLREREDLPDDEDVVPRNSAEAGLTLI